MTNPAVCIIILNYNDSDDTLECLQSLQECTYQPLHVLVVDNGSSDNSPEKIQKNYPEVEVLKAPKNLGFTGGVNFGIKHIFDRPVDYILLLNNDTYVEKDFLLPLVEAMEADPGVAAACGTIYAYHDKDIIWYAGGHMMPWRGLAVQDHKGERISKNDLGPPQSVTFVTGCMTMLRRSILKSDKVEDERLFLYYDDIELSARLLKEGYKLLYVPKSIIYHKVANEKESAWKLYFSTRNRLLLIKAAFPGMAGVIARFWFLSAITLKLVIWAFKKRHFFSAALLGLRDYFASNFYEGRGTARIKRK
jgi:GT2 family glycosyltransferase